MSTMEGSGYSAAQSPAIEGDIPTLEVVQVVAKECRPAACEMPLHIGLFFDGTGNNYNWKEGQGATQEARHKDSNVYRLYNAYPQDADSGYFPMYIPGVGTPFSEIGEDDEAGSMLGLGVGAGGDHRINYGLLHVLNSIHAMVSNDTRVFGDATIKALCRNGVREYESNYSMPMSAPSTRLEPLPLGDEAALRQVGMDQKGGLLRGGVVGDRQRRQFLTLWTDKIAERVLSPDAKPKLTEIFIDVFGFSRGSAEARVFCNWLLELMPDGKLCGVPAQIRFLGIFDTVASVGAPNSVPLVGGITDGHMDWARPEFLRVSKDVRNCVHYIAMHENRASFPLDFLNTPRPAHFIEYAFPGMHSDLGGGYTPQDQGRGPDGRDSQKLSQIPLNRMFDAAEEAGVPLDKSLASNRDIDPFEIDADLQSAYDAFMAEQPREGRTMRGWLLPYLAWRYQVRDSYTTMAWSSRLPAGSQDLEDLKGANELLKSDIKALDDSDTFGEKFINYAMDTSPITYYFSTNRRLSLLEDEARDLLASIRGHSPVSDASANLFANYMHDSYAGFRPFDSTIVGEKFGITRNGGWETPGYLRYRRWYVGDNKAMARIETQEQEDQSMVA